MPWKLNIYFHFPWYCNICLSCLMFKKTYVFPFPWEPYSEYLYLLHQITCLFYLFDYINQDLKFIVVKAYILFIFIWQIKLLGIYLYSKMYCLSFIHIHSKKIPTCLSKETHRDPLLHMWGITCWQPLCLCPSNWWLKDSPQLPSKWPQTDSLSTSAQFFTLQFYT